MKTSLMPGLLAGLLGVGSVLSVQAAAPPYADDEVILLRKAGFDTDNASLIEFLRVRSHGDVSQRHVESLIAQLGADEFSVRQAATQKLMALERGALAELREY